MISAKEGLFCAGLAVAAASGCAMDGAVEAAPAQFNGFVEPTAHIPLYSFPEGGPAPKDQIGTLTPIERLQVGCYYQSSDGKKRALGLIIGGEVLFAYVDRTGIEGMREQNFEPVVRPGDVRPCVQGDDKDPKDYTYTKSQ